MEPARIRDDVDPNSKKYRRELIAVIFIVLGLGMVGGTCLGIKIGNAEQANANAQTQAESTPDSTKAPNSATKN